MSRIEMDDELLDRTFALVRDDLPSAAQTAAAAQRTKAALRDEADKSPGAAPVSDYDALVQDYLAGRLSTAQRLLFEEELRSSAPLRRRVAAARGKPRRRGVQRVLPKRRGLLAHRGLWMGAAAAAVLIAVAGLLLPRFAIDQARLAQLTVANGVLYHVAEARLEPLVAGAWIDGGQRLRTAKDATAVLTLADGSEIEVGQRSQLSLSRQRSGSRIHVDRGRIIVQAAPQRAGSLHVATDELLVAVQGTIFGVSHGAQGSRVAVVEGEVDVRAGRKRTRLAAGGQFASRNAADASLESAVGWSRHASRYIAALREYAQLKKHGGGLLAATPRHSTRLLRLSPSGTFIYLAMPNAPAALANAVETLRALRTRLDASQPAGSSAGQPAESFEAALPWLRAVGGHLGAETVLTCGVVGANQIPAALFLAEVKPGEAAQLRDVLRSATLDELPISLVDGPVDAEDGQLSFWLREDLLAASTSRALLVELEVHLAGADNPFTASELYAELAEAYATGAEYLGGVDFGVEDFGHASAELENAIAQWRTATAHSSLTATLHLADGARIANTPWGLDRPAPIGALDFFSPQADLAAAAVVRDVDALVEAMLAEFAAVEELRSRGGLDFLDELAASLGGEFAIGIDGPLLPTPSWLAIVEVYDDVRLNQAMQTLAQRINEIAALRGDGASASWSRDDSGPYAVHDLTIAGDDGGSLSIRYAILNGYLIAAPSVELIERARQTFDSGVDLTTTAEFRELLPARAGIGFSAMAYARYADGLLAVLPKDGLDDSQREAIDQLRELVGPVFAGATVERDRIQLALNAAGAVTPMELAILASAGLFGDSEGMDGKSQAGAQMAIPRAWASRPHSDEHANDKAGGPPALPGRAAAISTKMSHTPGEGDT